PVPVEEIPQTKITRIAWVNSGEQEEDITEIGATQNASLIIEISNPEGTTVNITIEKEDGTEFESGKTQLSFTESITEDGVVEITPFEIKEQWEEFKTSEIDKLIAKVEHNGKSKNSEVLEIKPKPKATLHFRPHSSWKGEFGFDWMRIGDTSIDGDVTYEEIVGEYGKIYATNAEKAVFTPGKYKKLEKRYDPQNINSRKDSSGNAIEYYTPWLSIFKDSSSTEASYAELELLTEVDVVPDELYIEFPKKYFEIVGSIESPNDSTLKRFKLATAMKNITAAGSPNKTNIQLKCIDNLPKDETIKVWAANKLINGSLNTPTLSGMLRVKANDKKNRRVSKIVFVNVLTDINTKGCYVEGISRADLIDQENYLSPFLKQALINTDIEISTLDLSDLTKPEVQTLHKEFRIFNPVISKRIFNRYSDSKDKKLDNYLNEQFKSDPSNAKYKKYYKVFFLGEYGGDLNRITGEIKPLGGHANGVKSKECVMYKDPLPFFVAHELMHCMGLEHSFDNDSSHTFKIGQTENIMDYSHLREYATSPKGALKQISTWEWQWEKLKKKNEKEK
ncbi:hypothetical protein I2486_15190, partial [Cellulophaga sp. E16_2]|uniref:hypothetical protein n=1 Tax=Cellulophaga sp. E16_2 TaxID=2789297 RepID=UPI001A9167DB